MASAGALRRHGCEAPLHPSQIAVVAIGLLSAVDFYGFSVKELPELMRRTVVPLFSVQLATTVLLFVIISRFDPGQPRDQATHPAEDAASADETQVVVPSTAAVAMAPQTKTRPALLSSHPVVATCQDCGRLALTPDTRHCGRCNKCIPGYDHHCVYLNTCIGSRNYPLFVGLLSCSTLLLFTQQIVTGFAISRPACFGTRRRQQHASCGAVRTFDSASARVLLPRGAWLFPPLHRVPRADNVRVALSVAGTEASRPR
ncbi:hypothetical protein KRP22_005316 [Phytophthora ramorum]|nr:Protein S-acyltransferase 21 [Phytophthora ramorum]